MQDLACSWTPQFIVEIIKSLAWPLVILIIGLRFRNGFIEAVKGFLSKNNVSEISASTSGIVAKFVADKQSTRAKESFGAGSAPLPQSMSIESIKSYHEKAKTEFSEELYTSIRNHAKALNLADEEEFEILTREISLLQSALRFTSISKVLFRSQFNLFSMMANNSNYMSKEDTQGYFLSIKNSSGTVLVEWDWVKYMAYPVSACLLSDDGDGYRLTSIGRSYVAFMSRNPQSIDELSKL